MSKYMNMNNTQGTSESGSSSKGTSYRKFSEDSNGLSEDTLEANQAFLGIDLSQPIFPENMHNT
jgi:hypothetical protein